MLRAFYATGPLPLENKTHITPTPQTRNLSTPFNESEVSDRLDLTDAHIPKTHFKAIRSEQIAQRRNRTQLLKSQVDHKIAEHNGPSKYEVDKNVQFNAEINTIHTSSHLNTNDMRNAHCVRSSENYDKQFKCHVDTAISKNVGRKAESLQAKTAR